MGEALERRQLPTLCILGRSGTLGTDHS